MAALEADKLAISFRDSTGQGRVWTGPWATGSTTLLASFGSTIAHTAIAPINSSRLVVPYQDVADGGMGKLWYGDTTSGVEALGVIPDNQVWRVGPAIGVALTSGTAGSTVKVSASAVVAMPMYVRPMAFVYARQDGWLTTMASEAASTVPYGWGLAGNRIRTSGYLLQVCALHLPLGAHVNMYERAPSKRRAFSRRTLNLALILNPPLTLQGSMYHSKMLRIMHILQRGASSLNSKNHLQQSGKHTSPQ